MSTKTDLLRAADYPLYPLKRPQAELPKLLLCSLHGHIHFVGSWLVQNSAVCFMPGATTQMMTSCLPSRQLPHECFSNQRRGSAGPIYGVLPQSLSGNIDEAGDTGNHCQPVQCLTSVKDCAKAKAQRGHQMWLHPPGPQSGTAAAARSTAARLAALDESLGCLPALVRAPVSLAAPAPAAMWFGLSALCALHDQTELHALRQIMHSVP